MLDQELLFLGILKESPKHGYEIKKRIREIGENLALETVCSIYYPLRILEKNGLVTKKRGKEGNRPKKYTYFLTKKGSERFMELLEQSLLVIKRPNFDINVSLYFLPYVDKKVAMRRLEARQNFLNKIKEGVLKIKEAQSQNIEPRIAAILDHNLSLVQAEMDFVSKIIASTKEKA